MAAANEKEETRTIEQEEALVQPPTFRNYFLEFYTIRSLPMGSPSIENSKRTVSSFVMTIRATANALPA